MCGRYTLKRADRIKTFGRDVLEVDFVPIQDEFNIAPSRMLPVAAFADGKPVARLMRWGFVPFWDKSAKPKIAPANARSEEVFVKLAFRQALLKRRCLVPADGFYEWKKISEKEKRPFHIQLKGGRPFWFAGLYENATETRPETFALMTTRPNELMAGIHNRMPVILNDEVAKGWIRPDEMTAAKVSEICVPFASNEMEAFEVAPYVSNARNQGPQCIELAPAGNLVAEKSDGEQLPLL